MSRGASRQGGRRSAVAVPPPRAAMRAGYAGASRQDPARSALRVQVPRSFTRHAGAGWSRASVFIRSAARIDGWISTGLLPSGSLFPSETLYPRSR